MTPGAILISLLLLTQVTVVLRSTCIGGASCIVLLAFEVWMPASPPFPSGPILRLPLCERLLTTTFRQIRLRVLTNSPLCLLRPYSVQVMDILLLTETSMFRWWFRTGFPQGI